jgi:hypothetical protein
MEYMKFIKSFFKKFKSIRIPPLYTYDPSTLEGIKKDFDFEVYDEVLAMGSSVLLLMALGSLFTIKYMTSILNYLYVGGLYFIIPITGVFLVILINIFMKIVETKELNSELYHSFEKPIRIIGYLLIGFIYLGITHPKLYVVPNIIYDHSTVSIIKFIGKGAINLMHSMFAFCAFFMLWVLPTICFIYIKAFYRLRHLVK